MVTGSRQPGFFVVALAMLWPAPARAQEWLILQGIADAEFWASDSGSRLLTRNDGAPGVLGRVRLFAGIAPVPAVQLVALGEAGQVEHRLAQGLRRDRPGVQADAADHLALLADPDPAPQLGALDRGALAGGAGPDDEEVEAHHATIQRSPRGPARNGAGPRAARG